MPVGFIGGAAVGLIGDMMSQSGQSATNAQNMQMAEDNRKFQQGQTLQQQKFIQSQDVQAQTWNRKNTVQAQDYATQMADTAMQRRVADLKASGLNPLLAIGAGGAASPQVGPGSGAPAMAGSAGGGAQAVAQNPNSAFANLGSQLASAKSLESMTAQIGLLKAQAKKTTSETPDETGEPGIDPETGEVTVRDATHALGNAAVRNVNTNTDLQAAQKNQTVEALKLIQSNVKNVDQDTRYKNNMTILSGLNADVLRGTMNAMIAADNAANTLRQTQSKAQTTVWSGDHAQEIAYAQALLGQNPVGNAVKAATDIAGLATPAGRAANAVRGLTGGDPMGKLPVLSDMP